MELSLPKQVTTTVEHVHNGHCLGNHREPPLYYIGFQMRFIISDHEATCVTQSDTFRYAQLRFMY